LAAGPESTTEQRVKFVPESDRRDINVVKVAYSITSSAREPRRGDAERFSVLRLTTNSVYAVAERPSPSLLDQLGAKTPVLGVGY